ncbi:MAG TPA: adenine deaminase [Anaerolineae bacterium]|nr:adenine deaminase [Anaerolineae bacterium]
MEIADIVAAARGDSPVDLVLRNARIVNVFSAEVHAGDVAVHHSRIVGLGPGYVGREELDLAGAYLAPGFIDAHVHIESSMLGVREFARAVLPHGTTSVVVDPHEIANVHGLDGIRYMFDQAKYGRLSMFVMVPSCVPATSMATAGAHLDATDIIPLLNDPYVLGLAEMMNFPGVIHGEPQVVEKLKLFKGGVIDGHAPGLTGHHLNAYVAAGIGSDHECTTAEEALEKLRLGMYIFIREASNAHNLKDLLPLVTPENCRRFCFCTDDRHPTDLLEHGHIDSMVRTAISEGLDPVSAIRMATLNSADWFRLQDRGAIAPGRRADLVVFESFAEMDIKLVLRGGQIVARDGESLRMDKPDRPSYLRSSMNIDWRSVDFGIPAAGTKVRVIGMVPDQLITRHLVEDARIVNGCAEADIERDLLKVAVIERHMASGNMSKGFVKGLGLRRGALASTVAHDHHNLIVVGADDKSMMTAARSVAEMRGGLAVADGDKVLARVPLPVAGLMSEERLETVCAQKRDLLSAARTLGSPSGRPFVALSFAALEVIPALRLTDQGLVDVEKFEFVDLFVE